jgi:hypothetical protein
MVFSNKGGLFAPQGSSMLMPRDTKRNFILPSMKISEGIQPQLIKVADDRIQASTQYTLMFHVNRLLINNDL